MPTPIGCRVLIEVDRVEQSKEHKLHGFELLNEMKDQDNYTANSGTVLKIGKQAFQGEFAQYGEGEINVGDRVLFRKFAGNNITYKSGRILKVCEDVHILLKMDNDDEDLENIK